MLLVFIPLVPKLCLYTALLLSSTVRHEQHTLIHVHISTNSIGTCYIYLPTHLKMFSLWLVVFHGPILPPLEHCLYSLQHIRHEQRSNSKSDLIVPTMTERPLITTLLLNFINFSNLYLAGCILVLV